MSPISSDDVVRMLANPKSPLKRHIKPYKADIRSAIEQYFQATPAGLDVTAHVLNAIGEENMKSDSANTKRTLDQAKQEMGRMISEEFLPAMYKDPEKLSSVSVDPVVWPDLAKWVATYTQHRVGPRKPW